MPCLDLKLNNEKLPLSETHTDKYSVAFNGHVLHSTPAISQSWRNQQYRHDALSPGRRQQRTTSQVLVSCSSTQSHPINSREQNELCGWVDDMNFWATISPIKSFSKSMDRAVVVVSGNWSTELGLEFAFMYISAFPFKLPAPFYKSHAALNWEVTLRDAVFCPWITIAFDSTLHTTTSTNFP